MSCFIPAYNLQLTTCLVSSILGHAIFLTSELYSLRLEPSPLTYLTYPKLLLTYVLMPNRFQAKGLQ